MLADNLGRRASCILANSIIMIGCLTLIFSQNLWMASLGLVCCGISDSVYSIFASIQAECFSDYLRQKIGAIIQSTFVFGALTATLFYYLFESWLIASIYVLTIPAFINSFLFFWFVKETPMFLIRKSP
jgi:MFS family permease